ncbi:hypothetical protein Ciccas_009409, partial [Cichlidogyrus casuarinus]
KVCTMLGIGRVVQCDWDEPDKLPDNFEHYLVNISNGYSTRVKGNVVTLKDMKGLQLKLDNDYAVNISVVDMNGDSRAIATNVMIKISNHIYDQETMDNLAQVIARKLGGSKEPQERNLIQELAEISQPWSYKIFRLVLVISNDPNSFAGNAGRKTIRNRSKEPCSANHTSLARCQKLILKRNTKKNYVFDWPEKNEYGPGMNVQLRFHYRFSSMPSELDAKIWYATQ